jgi:hypothetical protein
VSSAFGVLDPRVQAFSMKGGFGGYISDAEAQRLTVVAPVLDPGRGRILGGRP